MPSALIFLLQAVLGYVAWLLVVPVYVWPRLRGMDPLAAQRAIAALHSFRFFGLAFLLPGFVGAGLPADFASFAAYGDFATGALAMLALATVRMRPLFWALVIAFNAVGTVDILVDYYHGNQVGLAPIAGQLGAGYAIPIVYVPLLMITHVAAFILLARRQPQAAPTRATPAAA